MSEFPVFEGEVGPVCYCQTRDHPHRHIGPKGQPLPDPMTAPVPAGPTDAHEALREELREALVLRGFHPSKELAELILALPTVRDALAAQETVRRVEALLRQWDAEGINTHGWLIGDLRRALDGE